MDLFFTVKNRKFFFFFVVLFVYSASAKEYTGVVTQKSDTEFEIRTASKNIKAKFGNKNSEDYKKLIELSKLNKISTFDVSNKAKIKEERIPFGVRGDCNELPLSIDDLINQVENGDENMSLVDFLDGIPKGTMESFTFITNSLSLQKGKGSHEVSEEWPRVLRSTMDGKVTISYVCHPEQEKHNSVEIIYFDDNTSKFKTLSFNFNAPKGRGTGHAGKGKRIHDSPKSCVSCHGTSSKNGEAPGDNIKINWPEYSFWGDCNTDRGITMYGMSDDNMGPGQHRLRPSVAFYEGCDSEKDLKAAEKLKKDFMKFKKKAKDNPCLSSLPWATLPKDNEERVGIEKSWTNEDYMFYPFANQSFKRSDEVLEDSGKTQTVMNYSVRPNLRFTDVYSHLTAKRNFQLLKNNPEYDKIKYYLAMEALGTKCLSKDETKAIANKMGLKLEKFNPASEDYHMIKNIPLTKSFAMNVVGFTNQDWTMHPPKKLSQNPKAGSDDYNAGIPSGDRGPDLRIHDLMMGHILLDVTQGPKQDITKRLMKPGISSDGVFGERFSCIDDLGMGIARSARPYEDEEVRDYFIDRSFLCTLLKEDVERLNKNNPISELEVSTKCEERPKDKSKMKKIVDRVLSDSAKKGAKHASKCIQCHSGDHELGFVIDDPSNPSAVEIQRLKQYANNGFWEKLRAHLKGDIQPKMPFGCDSTDSCLNKSEINELVVYMQSLVSKKYQNLAKKENANSCNGIVNGKRGSKSTNSHKVDVGTKSKTKIK